MLEEFPSLKLTSSFLLTQLPKLKPRFYSVSSSGKEYTDEIHLTVGVVEYYTKCEMSSMHYGVCSKWLDDIIEGEIIYSFFRRYY